MHDVGKIRNVHHALRGRTLYGGRDFVLAVASVPELQFLAIKRQKHDSNVAPPGSAVERWQEPWQHRPMGHPSSKHLAAAVVTTAALLISTSAHADPRGPAEI